jgi:hypothetical protein
LNPTARLTDELYIFFFDVNPLTIQIVDYTDEYPLDSPEPDRIRLVSDAEKAFVKILDSEYNVLKYSDYPEGEDGLYGEGFIRYGYVIDEYLTFHSGTEVIRGAHGTSGDLTALNDADFIFVTNNDVKLIKSFTYREE